MAAKRERDGGADPTGIAARGRRWWAQLDRGWQATLLGLAAVGLSAAL